jgi:hypothetical protein
LLDPEGARRAGLVLIAAYQSKSYQQALAVLDGAVVRDLRIIQGVD